MEVEPSDRFQDWRRRQIHRRVQRPQIVAERGAGGGRHERRLYLVRSGREQPLQDEAAFGNEQPLASKPAMIADMPVGFEPRIVSVVDAQDHRSSRGRSLRQSHGAHVFIVSSSFEGAQDDPEQRRGVVPIVAAVCPFSDSWKDSRAKSIG